MAYLRRIVRTVVSWFTPAPETGGPGGAIG
jgi:hypothetical protein